MSRSRSSPDETLQLVKTFYETGMYSQAALAEELNQRNVPTAVGSGKWWKNHGSAASTIKSVTKSISYVS